MSRDQSFGAESKVQDRDESAQIQECLVFGHIVHCRKDWVYTDLRTSRGLTAETAYSDSACWAAPVFEERQCPVELEIAVESARLEERVVVGQEFDGVVVGVVGVPCIREGLS